MRRCKRCILDESIPGIKFNEKGECQYCEMYDELIAKLDIKDFHKMIDKIKKQGKGKKYDVIVGFSGGCDSSWLLRLAKIHGLRPLAVHFDNGWNTDIAKKNLTVVTEKMDVDLAVYKIKPEHMNDINKAFLKAGVPDSDIPNDIALSAVLYHAACIFKVKSIFDGHNFRTEGTCPVDWSYMDARYIADVHKKYGEIPEAIDYYPNLWLKDWLYWIIVKRIKRYRPLYYDDTKKETMKKILKEKYGFKWYGGHHLENTYTAFCGNIMFPSFGTDRTIIELAAFVRSGNMTRQNAIIKLVKHKTGAERKLKKVVGNTLGINIDELLGINMLSGIRTSDDFKTYKKTFKRFRWFFWILAKLDLVPMTFYLKYCKNN